MQTAFELLGKLYQQLDHYATEAQRLEQEVADLRAQLGANETTVPEEPYPLEESATS